MENLESKRPQIAFFDMDGTLVEGQTQLSLIFSLRNKGYINNTAFLLIASWFLLYKLGIVSDPRTPLLYALKKLSVVPISKLEIAINDLVQGGRLKFIEPGVAALEECRRAGVRVVLISNALTLITNAVAKRLGVTEVIATRPAMHNDTLTGEIDGAIMYGQAKLDAAIQLCESSQVSMTDVAFYTDHDSDLPLLRTVGLPVAIRPNKKLRKAALRKHFKIID